MGVFYALYTMHVSVHLRTYTLIVPNFVFLFIGSEVVDMDSYLGVNSAACFCVFSTVT